MHAELLRMASEMAGREEPFVLAVVVRRQPASSAQPGDMALITATGEFHGWLGGSCTQPTVVREARRALADGKPRLLSLSPDPEADRRPGVAVFPMTCHSGGSVEIYLDPILPAARLLVYGASPIAQALARLGQAMGYSVARVEAAADEPTAAVAEAVPAMRASSVCYAVVATMGEGDEEAIRAALALRPAYLGVVASARRFAQLRQGLLARGVAAAALDSIRSPAGVAIGAQEPEEIAVSVLAEIVARRRAATPAVGRAAADAAHAVRTLPEAPEVSEAGEVAEAGEVGAAAATPTTPATPATPATPENIEAAAAPGQAIDPVCGMTVEIAGARHTAEALGRVWYFCCGGCRERFLAAPGRYSPAPTAPPRATAAAAAAGPHEIGKPRRSAGSA